MFQIIQAIVFFMALTLSLLFTIQYINAIAEKIDFDGNIPFYLSMTLWTILFYMSLIS